MNKVGCFVLAAAWLALSAGCGGKSSGGAAAAAGGGAPAPVASYYNIPTTPLGAQVSGASVTFSYWNDAATAVTVNLYANWNDSLAAPAATLPMTLTGDGVWSTGSVALPSQNFYVYQVGSSYVLDPYARSMAQWVEGGISGDSIGKGAILDPAAVGPDGGWSGSYFDGSRMKAADGVTAAPYAFSSNRDAIVYEAGVRDLTVDPFLTGFALGHTWGTFKGLIDLLPHIQKLGVTHVQLLCPLENYYYNQTLNGQRELNPDFTAGCNYNWGYDPQNYFTPTGMYSANPADPAARINELKTLVDAIHQAGMGVILDVVYNHTANDNILGAEVNPGYWYRSTSLNSAGSHDVASEHMMVRKLIVDSVSQWVNDYHVDGFRFDIMGEIDTQTVKDAYAAATAANPLTVFLGEGWNGFYSGAASDYEGVPIAGSDQQHIAAFKGLNVAMFSDSFRQIFKNGYPNDGAPAFLTGQAQSPAGLFANVAGQPTSFSPPSTNNVVNYLSCHDNLCYYDVLAMASNATKAQDGTILQRAKLGYAVLLTSQGLAFIQAGDEMFRTKECPIGGDNTLGSSVPRYFCDNSYNASDAINMVGWSRVYAADPIAAGFTNYDTSQHGYQLYAYTQGLIALRRSSNAFRLPDASIPTHVTSLPATGAGTTTLAFGYSAAATDGTGTYFVFHNADSVAHSFPVAAGLSGATLLVDGQNAGLTALTASTSATLSADGLTVTLQPLSSAVWRK